MNQIRRFMSFQAGDRIVVPYYDGVCLATIVGERRYSKDAKRNDLSNQISVDYEIDPATGQPRVIPRDALSEALQRRLRVRGSTLSDLWEFKEEVDRMFNEIDYSWTGTQAKEEERVKEQFRLALLNRIQDGATNLKTGGIGLERLVKELFEHEGYEAKVLDKRHFRNGDADVEAVRSDIFGRTKILAQIKHHSGVTNDWGLEQLLEIKRTETEDNVILVLMTTAVIPDAVKVRADDNDVQVMDGKALSEWVMGHLHNLQPDTRARLGISKVPRFVSEGEASLV